MENLNRVLLENVLPAHVAEHFLARNWKNEVTPVVYCPERGIDFLCHDIMCTVNILKYSVLARMFDPQSKGTRFDPQCLS